MTPERLSPDWFDCVFPAHYLRQRLDYDPATGLFAWRDLSSLPPNVRARMAGNPALATRSSAGYLRGVLDGVEVLAHRVAWAIHSGAWPRGDIDHVNRVRTDNRFSNLRDVSTFQNIRNQCPLSHGPLRAVGVGVRGGRFLARIKLRGCVQHLGTFDTVEEAVAARFQAEIANGWPRRSETLAERQAAAKAAWLSRSK